MEGYQRTLKGNRREKQEKEKTEKKKEKKMKEEKEKKNFPSLRRQWAAFLGA